MQNLCITFIENASIFNRYQSKFTIYCFCSTLNRTGACSNIIVKRFYDTHLKYLYTYEQTVYVKFV